MRISTQQVFQGGINAILDNQESVARIQLQLSKGERLLRPSDDPVASAAALGLEERISQTEQHQKNIGFARTRLVEEEITLSAAINSLQRVRELAIAANDAVLTGEERGFIAVEIRQRLSELVAIANSQDASGEHLFSGFQSRTQPFALDPGGAIAYAGDEGVKTVGIGAGAQVALGDSGHAVFRTIRNGNGDFTTLDAAGNSGSGVIDPGSVTNPTAFDRDTYTVVLGARTNVSGGAIGLVDTGNNDTLTYQLSINGTVVDTLNEGESRTQAQLETAINAQVGTTGVRAYLDAGTLTLANTTPGAGAISVTEQLGGASDATDAVMGFFGSNLTGAGPLSSTSTLGPEASGYIVLDSAANIDASGAYLSGAGIEWNGIRTNITESPHVGDTFTVSPSVNQDLFSTVENLAISLENDADGALHNALSRFLVDVDQGMSHLDRIRASIGGRLGILDTQADINTDFSLQLTDSLSGLRDLDFAQAASDLSLQITGLQAAQQAFLRVQGLSLFNLL